MDKIKEQQALEMGIRCSKYASTNVMDSAAYFIAELANRKDMPKNVRMEHFEQMVESISNSQSETPWYDAVSTIILPVYDEVYHDAIMDLLTKYTFTSTLVGREELEILLQRNFPDIPLDVFKAVSYFYRNIRAFDSELSYKITAVDIVGFVREMAQIRYKLFKAGNFTTDANDIILKAVEARLKPLYTETEYEAIIKGTAERSLMKKISVDKATV